MSWSTAPFLNLITADKLLMLFCPLLPLLSMSAYFIQQSLINMTLMLALCTLWCVRVCDVWAHYILLVLCGRSCGWHAPMFGTQLVWWFVRRICAEEEISCLFWLLVALAPNTYTTTYGYVWWGGAYALAPSQTQGGSGNIFWNWRAKIKKKQSHPPAMTPLKLSLSGATVSKRCCLEGQKFCNLINSNCMEGGNLPLSIRTIQEPVHCRPAYTRVGTSCSFDRKWCNWFQKGREDRV